jgi:hypothetical protein
LAELDSLEARTPRDGLGSALKAGDTHDVPIVTLVVDGANNAELHGTIDRNISFISPAG